MACMRVLIGLTVLLAAACSAPTVKEISGRPPVLTVAWPGDQKSAARCIVQNLDELGWRSVVREFGSSTQVIWNGPGSFGITRPIAVFEITSGKIEMHAGLEMDNPGLVRQAWKGKIAGCQ